MRKNLPSSRPQRDPSVRLPLLLSLITAMTVLQGASVQHVSAATRNVPRMVVSILVDQLRTDYLDAFMPLYGEEGFVRLMKEGRVYTQAEYPHSHLDRASSAATLSTGSAPSQHGIVSLKWLDRKTLRPIFCVDDKQYAGIGTTDASAPTFLGVSTFGDELKVATSGKAIVYGIAPWRDAAILSAGHAADAAIWIDDHTGQWCSSTYYAPLLPAWAAVLNAQGGISYRAQTWSPSNELVGNFSYFLSGGMKTPFFHKFKGDSRFVSYKTSGLVNEEVARAASQCIDGTLIGTDDITDYLAVTFYAGNYEHRTVSESPMELQDNYVRLDRAVATLVKAVERRVGKGNALFVVTSTGYADEENSDLSAYRIPTGTFDVKRAASLLNMYLVAIYGQGQFVEACSGTQLYLDHRLIEQKQISLSEMLERTQDFLLQLSGVKDVYTSTRLLQGAWTPGISKIRGGYNSRFSGDVLIEVAPGWHYVNSDAKEDQLVRESYIPFPVIFFGQGCEADTITEPVSVDYIAPTLSKSVRIRAPNACSLPPLF